MDREEEQYQAQFSHKPVRAPRNGFIGEQVFAALWEERMADSAGHCEFPNEMLAEVLCSYRPAITQHEATVVASLITWLGTDCGRVFLHEADWLAKANSTVTRSMAYLQEWAVANVRAQGVNNSVRTLEFCLTPASAWKASTGETLSRPTEYVELTANDLEAADCVAVWLGGPHGQEFLTKCRKEIEARQPYETLQHHLENNLKLNPEQIDAVIKLAQEASSPALAK